MAIMGLAEIMDKSIALLKKYLGTIAVFAIIYALITVGMMIVIFLVFGVFSATVVTSLDDLSTLWIILPLVLVAVITVLVCGRIGIIKIASQEFTGEKVDMPKALAYSMKSIPKIAALVLILAILFIPIGVGAYFLFKTIVGSYMASFDIMDIEVMGTFPWLVLISIIIIILTSMILLWAYYTFFSFTLFAITIERKGVFRAISRGIQLIRYNFWKVFGYNILFYFSLAAIKYSIQSFISIIAALIYLLLQSLNVGVDYLGFIQVALNITQWPMYILFALVVSPISTIMLTMLYYNQRFKKEGMDMILRLREIEKNEERKHLGETFKFNNPV